MKKRRKKSTLFFITSLLTLYKWSGKDPGTNKSSNRRLIKIIITIIMIIIIIIITIIMITIIIITIIMIIIII